MEERILIAGAGGQGALTVGKFLATVAMDAHRVTFFPSYGAEVRGGTAHCHVVISEDEIATPVVDQATTMIIMNQMSYQRFAENVQPDGLLLVNDSMVRCDPPPPCRQVVRIPATQLAGEMGDIRIANMILLGALNTLKPVTEDAAFLSVMERTLGKDPSKAKILELDKQAYRTGADQARKSA